MTDETKISSESPNNEIRLTTRAKRIGAGVLAIGTLTAVLAAGANHLSTDRGNQDVLTTTTTADTGDTLWDMANGVKNVEDVRDVTYFAEQNSPDLRDGTLDAGDTVVLPVDANDLK